MIYFGLDYMEIASNALQKVIQIEFRNKKKLRIVQYLNYSNYASFNSWNEGEISIKLGTKHAIY